MQPIRRPKPFVRLPISWQPIFLSIRNNWNMTRVSPWQSYRRVATHTASPGQLVLMLFEGAIRFLEQARQGFLEQDPLAFNQTINNNVQRAQAILNELSLSLN